MAFSGALPLSLLIILLLTAADQMNGVTAVPPEELHAVLRVLRSSGYGRVEDAIAMSDLSFDFLSAGTLTLFAPPDSSLFPYDIALPVPPASYISVLRYHTVPRRLSISDLRILSSSSVMLLPTLLPDRFLNVTVKGADLAATVEVDGVLLDSPGLYYGIHVAVHGLAGSLTDRRDKTNRNGSPSMAPDVDAPTNPSQEILPPAASPSNVQEILPPAASPSNVKEILPPATTPISAQADDLTPATPPVDDQAIMPPAPAFPSPDNILPPVDPPTKAQQTLPPAAAPPFQVEDISSPAATPQELMPPNQEWTNPAVDGELAPPAATQLPDEWVPYGDLPSQVGRLPDISASPDVDRSPQAAPPVPETRGRILRGRRRGRLLPNSNARRKAKPAVARRPPKKILSLRRRQQPRGVEMT